MSVCECTQIHTYGISAREIKNKNKIQTSSIAADVAATTWFFCYSCVRLFGWSFFSLRTFRMYACECIIWVHLCMHVCVYLTKIIKILCMLLHPKIAYLTFNIHFIYHVYTITRSLNYINFEPWILFLYYYCYFCIIFFLLSLQFCSFAHLLFTHDFTHNYNEQTHTTTAVRMLALPDSATAAVAGVNLTCKTTRHSKNDSF